jgi:hypothetical protein
MRTFAVLLVVVTWSAFVAFAVYMSKVSFSPFASSGGPVGTTTPPGPVPQELKVTVAGAHGFDVITQGENVVGEVQAETGTCADPFKAMKTVPHSGRTRVTRAGRSRRALGVVRPAVAPRRTVLATN